MVLQNNKNAELRICDIIHFIFFYLKVGVNYKCQQSEQSHST